MAITGEKYKRWQLNTLTLISSTEVAILRHPWPGLGPNTSWPAVKQTLVGLKALHHSTAIREQGQNHKVTCLAWETNMLMTRLWKGMTDRVRVDKGVVRATPDTHYLRSSED